jgi:hypothetical protein
MIDPRELRIGNILDLGIAVGIYPSDTETYNIWLSNGFSFSADKLSAEPTTEEWLVRFGFKNVDRLVKNNFSFEGAEQFIRDDYRTILKHNNIFYYILDINTDNYGDDVYTYKEVEFIHTLQNIHYFYTGEELTIKG